MSEKNNGGPAFPCDAKYDSSGSVLIRATSSGMTLRDWFAGEYLKGMSDPSINLTPAQIALECYTQADAMLAERDK